MVAPPYHPESEREGALLAWIQQSAPYGIVTLNESLCVQSWNQWMEQHSGMQFKDVVGKSLLAVFPDLHARKLAFHFERALRGEACVLSSSLHRYLLPLPSPFREPGVVHMLQTARISPLYSNEKICGVVLVIEDVTQRESQAEALARQHRRDELFSWALAHLLKTEQPRKAVRQLFFKIAEQLDFDTFIIYLRDPETGELKLEAVGGVPVESEKEFFTCPFPTGDSPEILVLDSAQIQRETQYAPLQRARVSAAVCIPLLANDRNLGWLCFASWSRGAVGTDETDLVTRIAQFLATALDRENTSRQLHNAKAELGEHALLLEEKVQERTARLQDTIDELETFSYTIAHDLRAPVRAMVGYCDLLLEDQGQGLSAETRKIIQRIGRASSRMEALTRDLLEFSRISRQEVTFSQVEIEPLIEEIASLRGPPVRQAITIQAPIHPVRAHKGLLQQVLSNLVDNAVKFVALDTPPKITISSEVVSHSSPNTRARPLLFSSTAAGSPDAPGSQAAGAEHIRIWVRDEGVGVPREAHQKIFGIFERAVTSSYEGTGIGLAIVARAMQRMGGTCGVESEPGKGSHFWIELPAP